MGLEPSELNRKGSPEVGVDDPRTVCEEHGLRVQAGASKHQRTEGCRRDNEAFPNLLCFGARDAVTNRRAASPDGPVCPHG
jgi:hypothetical protein